MPIMESVAESQAWVIAAFVFVALILWVPLPTQRRAIGAYGAIFILALALLVVAKALGSAGSTGAIVRDTGVFLEGAVFVGLSAILVFRGLLPALGSDTPSILQDVSLAMGLIVWLLVMLSMHNVDVAGIVATSAVLTAVIGLAMQDTLGNIVAGLAIQLDGSVHVGDFVKIDDVSGRVAETRWRYTAIETGDWETVVIPNSTLSKAKVIVRGLRRNSPHQWRRWVWFNLDFRYSPSRVIEVVESAVHKTSLPQIAADPPPNCVAMEFADSYTRYAVRYWLNDLTMDVPTDSELRAHIFSALHRAGMSLSIPAHAVFMTEETAERKEQKVRHALSEGIAVLHNVSMFQKLPKVDLEHLAERLVHAPYNRGDIITQQGTEPQWLFLLTEGTADRFIANQEHESLKVGELTPGHVFGEWSLMTGTLRETTVIATSQVNCYRLSKEAFLDAVGRNPQLYEEIAGSIAQYRTQLEMAQQHLDEDSRAKRHNENKSRVLESIKRLLRVS